eukprot:scaffold95955_cov58-Attheya_sp.AAC.4
MEFGFYSKRVDDVLVKVTSPAVHGQFVPMTRFREIITAVGTTGGCLTVMQDLTKKGYTDLHPEKYEELLPLCKGMPSGKMVALTWNNHVNQKDLNANDEKKLKKQILDGKSLVPVEEKHVRTVLTSIRIY